MSDVRVPTNNRYLDSKKEKARNDTEAAFNDYKKLLSDKTHPDNQTPGYHKNVVSTLNRLLVAADSLDEANPGEGIFGLIVLSLRSSLKLRDDNIKLALEIRELKREIDRVKKNQGAK
jgi:hypothetical protein